jgi:hypothetical protein
VPVAPLPYFTAAMLTAAVRLAAHGALPDPATGRPGFRPAALPMPGHPDRPVCWGPELDLRPISSTPGDDAGVGGWSAERVAGYIAKYATKSTEAFGPVLDRRILVAAELDHLRVNAHIARLVRTCWQLGADPTLDHALRLRAWAHQVGFGSHVATKSRRYATTLGALRQARREHAARARWPGGLPLDAWGRRLDDDQVLVVADWTYAGRGYQTTSGALLAGAARARARERERERAARAERAD